MVEASTLSGRKANTEIPVILAYDMSHYESLVPDSQKDIAKSVDLKKMYVEGRYSKRVADIPVLMEQLGGNSYAKAVQRNFIISDGSKKMSPGIESNTRSTDHITSKNKDSIKRAETFKKGNQNKGGQGYTKCNNKLGLSCAKLRLA